MIKEWYGGSTWCPFGAPEPDRPEILWLQSGLGKLTRVVVDYATRTWRVHSNYDANKLAGGLYSHHYIWGTGLGVWKPRVHNGIHYLAVDVGPIAVLRVDEENWRLLPCVFADFSDHNVAKAFLWTDLNADGQVQESEHRKYSWGIGGGQHWTPRIDSNFNYTILDQSRPVVWRMRVTDWTAEGIPVYEDLPDAYANPFAQLPASMKKPIGRPNFYPSAHAISVDPQTGAMFGAFGIGDKGWGKTDNARVVKWDKSGTFLWEAATGGYNAYKWREGWPRNPVEPPDAGKVGCFKNNVGVVHGCVFTQDFSGGWDHMPAVGYVWNADGLWVGWPFWPRSQIATTKEHPWFRYHLSGENGAHALYIDPATRYRGPPTFGVNACTRKWEGCRSRYCIEGKAKGDSLSVQTNPRRAIRRSAQTGGAACRRVSSLTRPGELG